jgi:hypothetical protein
MSTDHLSAWELQQRITERQAALDRALDLLIKQCRVKLLDQEGVIAQAQQVTSAAMALRQCKEVGRHADQT